MGTAGMMHTVDVIYDPQRKRFELRTARTIMYVESGHKMPHNMTVIHFVDGSWRLHPPSATPGEDYLLCYPRDTESAQFLEACAS